MRFPDERMEKELIPLVKKASEEISAKLGFQK
jgi:DNA-binding IclR family transcriptional regulator